MVVWGTNGQLSRKREIFSSHSEGSTALIHWRHDEQHEPHHFSRLWCKGKHAILHHEQDVALHQKNCGGQMLTKPRLAFPFLTLT